MKRFETEDYFLKYEFSKPYQLASSDCETINVQELLALGGGSPSDLLHLTLGYTEMPGSEILRNAIAGLYRGVSSEQVMVLGSPIEGLYLAMQALLKPGEQAIVLSPAYDALFNVAEHFSKNATRWFLKNDGAKWSLDFDSLEKIITPNTKLLVFNFPHNPTGFVPSESELRKLVEIAGRHGIRILSDEIYRGLELPGVSRLPSVAELTENSVVLSGGSKGWGLPGLRFGWLVIKDRALYAEFLNLKSYTSMCASQTTEFLGLMAVRAAPKLLQKNLAIISQNMQAAEEFFLKWRSQFEWLKPLGGSVSVFKVAAPSAEKFCHKMANDFGVVLLPTKFMGYEDRYVRIGLGRKNFSEGLTVWDKAMGSM